MGAARPVATVTGRGKTGAGAGPGPGVSLVLPVPQIQVSGRENAPRQAQQASAATWGPGLRWAGWREKEEAALGSVSETELLGTPGGSSCSEPEPRATLGGSGGARNSKGREVRAGSRSPPQVRRECFRKQGPEGLCSYQEKEPFCLHAHRRPSHPFQIFIRKGQGRRDDEKRSLPASPHFSSPCKGSSQRGADVKCQDFLPFSVRWQVCDRISDCDRRETAGVREEPRAGTADSQRAPRQGSVTLNESKKKHANTYERDLGRNNTQRAEEERFNPILRGSSNDLLNLSL